MKSSAIRWIWLSIVIVVLDQLSKYYITQHFELFQSMQILPGINLTYVQNTGAAFSILSDAAGWQRWLFISLSSGVSVMLLIWLKKHPSSGIWLAITLALILGGAVGNLIDRVIFGYVIDFIDIYYNAWHWPAFNVADSAISIGVGMLIVDSFWFDQGNLTMHSGDIKKD